MRRDLRARRRHFFNKRVSLVNYVASESKPEEMLIDDSATASMNQLGNALTELEINGHFFGLCSLTLVLHGHEARALHHATAEAMKTMGAHDGCLFEETYNLLNAWLATLPGNGAHNLRRLALLETNAADLSFIFKLDQGERVSQHLQQEALAVFETPHHTTYAFNLHVQDVGRLAIQIQAGRENQLHQMSTSSKSVSAPLKFSKNPTRMDAMMLFDSMLFPMPKARFKGSPIYNKGVEADSTKIAAAVLTERVFEIFARAAKAELPAGTSLPDQRRVRPELPAEHAVAQAWLSRLCSCRRAPTTQAPRSERRSTRCGRRLDDIGSGGTFIVVSSSRTTASRRRARELQSRSTSTSLLRFCAAVRLWPGSRVDARWARGRWAIGRFSPSRSSTKRVTG